jgi:hypothetical protein
MTPERLVGAYGFTYGALVQEEAADKLVRSSGTFLARWKGASARVRHHGPSHGNVEIVLERNDPDRASNLTLSFVPAWWHGPFQWDDARLRVERAGSAGFKISDNAADFSCLTDWFEVKENVKL